MVRRHARQFFAVLFCTSISPGQFQPALTSQYGRPEESIAANTSSSPQPRSTTNKGKYSFVEQIWNYNLVLGCFLIYQSCLECRLLNLMVDQLLWASFRGKGCLGDKLWNGEFKFYMTMKKKIKTIYMLHLSKKIFSSRKKNVLLQCLAQDKKKWFARMLHLRLKKVFHLRI